MGMRVLGGQATAKRKPGEISPGFIRLLGLALFFLLQLSGDLLSQAGLNNPVNDPHGVLGVHALPREGLRVLEVCPHFLYLRQIDRYGGVVRCFDSGALRWPAFLPGREAAGDLEQLGEFIHIRPRREALL
jgi:hypothetical protein